LRRIAAREMQCNDADCNFVNETRDCTFLSQPPCVHDPHALDFYDKNDAGMSLAAQYATSFLPALVPLGDAVLNGWPEARPRVSK
jgi:hypothetical protein